MYKNYILHIVPKESVKHVGHTDRQFPKRIAICCSEASHPLTSIKKQPLVSFTAFR